LVLVQTTVLQRRSNIRSIIKALPMKLEFNERLKRSLRNMRPDPWSKN